jgi:hypothetical protein
LWYFLQMMPTLCFHGGDGDVERAIGLWGWHFPVGWRKLKTRFCDWVWRGGWLVVGWRIWLRWVWRRVRKGWFWWGGWKWCFGEDDSKVKLSSMCSSLCLSCWCFREIERYGVKGVGYYGMTKKNLWVKLSHPSWET